jgi:hypothetical protein
MPDVEELWAGLVDLVIDEVGLDGLVLHQPAAEGVRQVGGLVRVGVTMFVSFPAGALADELDAEGNGRSGTLKCDLG